MRKVQPADQNKWVRGDGNLDATTKFYTVIIEDTPRHAHRDEQEIRAHYNRAVRDGESCELWVSDGKAALDRLWSNPDEVDWAERERGSSRVAHNWPKSENANPAAAAEDAHLRVTVSDPDDPHAMPIYDGPAALAPRHLVPGTYDATDQQFCAVTVEVHSDGTTTIHPGK